LFGKEDIGPSVEFFQQAEFFALTRRFLNAAGDASTPPLPRLRGRGYQRLMRREKLILFRYVAR